MSHELLELVKGMNRDNLNLQLALQCSPLLSGIKISNILNVSRNDAKQVEELFHGTPISCYILYQTGQRTTFLLYQKERVLDYLTKSDVRAVMAILGYDDIILEHILNYVSIAYEHYMTLKMQKDAFPHELGLLLGYPPEDVLGYILNQGKNSLCTGYWKVYGDPNQAAQTFAQYDMAKEQMVRKVYEGVSISYMIHTYYSNRQTG